MGRQTHLKNVAKLVLVALVATGLQSCGRAFYADWPNNHRSSSHAQSIVHRTSGPSEVRVGRGDTLSEIAMRHDVPFRALASANNIRPPYTIFVGQELTLPSPPTHTVRRGESLSVIAARYDLSTRELAQLNNIRRADRIDAGQELALPWSAATTPSGGIINRNVAANTAPTTSQPQAASRTTERAAPQPRRVTPQPASVASARELAPPPRSGQGFMWPVDGQIISSFGPKEGGQHNDGINIAVPEGTDVRAADAGVVIYAGNEVPGYGNLVLVRHENGYVTAYAHNSRLRVTQGAVVERGQVLAQSGRTGRVTEPQVHFEVRRNSQVINPAQFLAGA